MTATGTLSALVTVQVGTQVSGRIKEINVDFNSPVKKGQVIAKIEPALFQAALESARANYLAAQGTVAKLEAQAENAKLQYERAEALFERKAIAQADLDTARATMRAANGDVVAARGNLAQAKASLNQAQVNLDYTTIVSPTTGVVISRSVDVGQTVAASLSAPTLFLIAEDLTKMQVDTSVAEADIGKLKPDMDATFTVDAYPSRHVQGEDPADPQRAADAAERRHLRRGDRRRQRRAGAEAGHDRQRHLHLRPPRQRAARRQRGAALPAAAGARARGLRDGGGGSAAASGGPRARRQRRGRRTAAAAGARAAAARRRDARSAHALGAARPDADARARARRRQRRHQHGDRDDRAARRATGW